jgi:hypothetical protein
MLDCRPSVSLIFLCFCFFDIHTRGRVTWEADGCDMVGFVCIVVELCFVEDVRKVMPTNSMHGLATVLADVFRFIWSTR